MGVLVGLSCLILAVLAVRGTRWAYGAFVALGLLYFPLRAGFALAPRACQLALDARLVGHSLQNYAHVVLFAGFFLVSRAQFRGRRGGSLAFLATVAMGALVELAQGLSGHGNCRLRDLIPDTAGALVGATLLVLSRGVWRSVRGARAAA